ncbi:hypothetical protein BJF82_10440 [Kytococcus sp. CUA-901]|nr:hypothetical protein BJF82_10440 [Kytococcus sp. CUA-901]
MPMMLPVLGGDRPSVPPTVLGEWIQDAAQVERAHRATIAWLRSRLPGYPQLPAPQLARGTQLTTHEFTRRLVWTRHELAAGFQFQDPSVVPLRTLGATEEHAARAAEATRRLSRALAQTGEWQRLAEATAVLSSSDRAELLAARKTINKVLKPEAIDAYEPELALPRDAYRRQVVADAVDTLNGASHEFAVAFEDVDRLLEFSCSMVFGQLAVYRTVSVESVTDLGSDNEEPGCVEFAIASESYVDPGALCWLNDPLLPDAVFLTAVTYDFDQASGMKLLARGRVLAGTATTWARPAP